MLVKLRFYNIDHLGLTLQNTTVWVAGLLLVTRTQGALHTWSTYSTRKRAVTMASNRPWDRFKPHPFLVKTAPHHQWFCGCALNLEWKEMSYGIKGPYINIHRFYLQIRKCPPWQGSFTAMEDISSITTTNDLMPLKLVPVMSCVSVNSCLLESQLWNC